MGRIAKRAAMIAALALAACATTPSGFTPRLTTPRLGPVPATHRTEAQRDMLASRGDLNIYKTLAWHPDLYNRWSPLGQFILNGSSIQPRHREMAMLRMGWLCQAEYEWAQHARIAQGAPGLTKTDIHAIAEGPGAKSWSALDAAVLTMTDELRYDAIISDKTWTALRAGYSDQQIMELLFTAAQYQLVSMALNTLGVQDEPTVVDHLPADVPKPAIAKRPTSPRLSTPRIAPIAQASWTPEQRAMIAPQLQPDGTALNLYTTMLNHPKLYTPRSRFGSYLQRDSLLPPRTRELLILRTGYDLNASYEWSHHFTSAKAAGLTDEEIARIAKGPSAPGWSEADRALLTAADELRREAFVSDTTWATLSKSYDIRRLIEIVYTVGGYTMTGLAINSFGIQTEPGFPPMPG
ncbi:MAG: carboxymuconolactone decarboxylase family protein [Alphaproteobacteria bacterium]